ncbi:hypothetical protein [Corynebacterium propinquum]|uniref:hypothetical protein n=1 Tax=Corynebacterium propinquum TaxID=43769 RepID=UPI001EF31FA1|nr:hypothetical protein [Corynebacterium propinquum]MCG7231396.1 hypothetical protein [Corynebacterium propinquum]MDK4303533.1 hypothetical protein [Corynebacterium propinquum]MDK8535751.1 hypothetical protein [Corynebacterium propinquum]WKS27276.1 hypothetical protein NLL49_08655 [Corynebacterium propinquum]WKS44073.1 hypothetical protein NLL36_05995 [Corynebacterium propinquum]
MSTQGSQRSHTAGAFDIRNVIGALLGLYGLILLLSFFFLDPGVDAATGAAKDSSYNLWTGVAMLIAAGVFFWWTKANPIKIDEADAAAEPQSGDSTTR